MAEIDWTERAGALLRGELQRRGVSYKQLADRLVYMGVPETEKNVADRIARGDFTTVFFIQCLEAAGAPTIHLDY